MESVLHLHSFSWPRGVAKKLASRVKKLSQCQSALNLQSVWRPPDGNRCGSWWVYGLSCPFQDIITKTKKKLRVFCKSWSYYVSKRRTICGMKTHARWLTICQSKVISRRTCSFTFTPTPHHICQPRCNGENAEHKASKEDLWKKGLKSQ